jgi:2-oxo-3-hexenedioate decarboxylase
MKMKVDGEVVQEGSSEAISGDPFQSIVEQVNLLGQRDLTIPAGTWILAGAATPAYPLTKPCEVSLEVEGLGNVIAKIVKE